MKPCSGTTFTSGALDFLCIEDRADGGGGFAVLVRKKILAKRKLIQGININNRFQSIMLEFDKFNLFLAYNLPDIKLSYQHFYRILQEISSKPFLIVGDLNGQHPLWGSGITNNNGTVLYDIIDHFNLVVINNGSPTRITPPHQNISCSDVLLSHTSLAPKLTFQVLEPYGPSDHLPILSELHMPINHTNLSYSINTNSTTRYNTKKADWNGYRALIAGSLSECKPTSITEFNRVITEAADQTIPRSRSRAGSGFSHPWWDTECSIAIQKRKDSFSQYRKHPMPHNYVNFRKVRAQCRRVLREKKAGISGVLC